MSRQGAVTMLLLALLGALGIGLGVLAVVQHQTIERFGERRGRVQAREWALGAQVLQIGAERRIDDWILRREADAAIAIGRRWWCRLDIVDGRVVAETIEPVDGVEGGE